MPPAGSPGMGKKKSKGSQLAARASKAERIEAALGTEAVQYRGHRAVRTVGLLSKASDQPPLLALSAVTLAAGLVLNQPRLARAGVRMLASELLATGIKAGIKRYVARTRPHKMLEDGRYLLHPDKKAKRNEGPWNSFPSGHTAGAVAVGRAFSREYPQASGATALTAVAVGAVQLPLGNHFASDVVAGALVGFISEAVVDRLVATSAADMHMRMA